MPRRLAIAAPFVVEVVPYEEPSLQPNQVRVKSELASAKHGTNISLFEGANFVGQRFDPEEHIFRPAAPAAGPDRAAVAVRHDGCRHGGRDRPGGDALAGG